MTGMRILPVIDVLNGVVVRGVAGRRNEYRPIASRWTNSTNPLDIASALEQTFGFRRFYLADLDGIVQGRPNLDLYRRLADRGYELLIDAGVRETRHAAQVLQQGAQTAIVGLETLASIGTLVELIEQFTADRIVFSLDLKQGQPQQALWLEQSPLFVSAA